MIRRPPTLIPLDDSDVQTVRDLLDHIRQEKEEERRVQEQTLSDSNLNTNSNANANNGVGPGLGPGLSTLTSAPEGLTAQARQHARNERLGLR